MKYEYTLVYAVTGMEHRPNEDVELLVNDGNTVRVVLTRDPGKFDASARYHRNLFESIASWLEQRKVMADLTAQCRAQATTPPSQCKDAPHVVIQISGQRQDLDGRVILEDNHFVVHLNPNDPSDSIRNDSEDTIAMILVSLLIESGGAIAFKKVMDLVAMIREDGKHTIPLVCSQAMDIADTQPLDNNATARIVHCYGALSARSKKDFGTICRLLKSSLEAEDDKLRCFLFGWSALEMFCNKVFGQYEARMFEELGGNDRSTVRYSVIGRMRDVMKKGKFGLSDKFNIIALHLSATDAPTDSDAFRTAKRVRDELFHGVSVDETALPTASLRGLLVKYLQLHLGGEARPSLIKKVMSIRGRFTPGG